jgi:hypothetical protein
MNSENFRRICEVRACIGFVAAEKNKELQSFGNSQVPAAIVAAIRQRSRWSCSVTAFTWTAGASISHPSLSRRWPCSWNITVKTVEKQKLLDTVWQEAFVTEDSLVKSVREICRALGDEEITQTLPV